MRNKIGSFLQFFAILECMNFTWFRESGIQNLNSEISVPKSQFPIVSLIGPEIILTTNN